LLLVSNCRCAVVSVNLAVRLLSRLYEKIKRKR